MISKLILLHLRWLAIFLSVTVVMTLVTQMQSRDTGKLADPEFWRGMAPVFAVCLALALIMPWAVFFIDPRRKESPSIPALIQYWRSKRK